jgi:hypothetical protein
MEKIDRAFMNIYCDQTFPNSSISSLTHFVSHHVPIIASISTSVLRPAFFRFENNWASQASCHQTVNGLWASMSFRPTQAKAWSQNSNKLGSRSKKWQRTILPNHMIEAK